MKKFSAPNRAYIRLSGPLKSTSGGRTMTIPSTDPISVVDLILSKKYGNGFSLSSSVEEVPVGEEASYPKLLGEVMNLEGTAPSPRFEEKSEIGKIDTATKSKSYISIYNILLNKNKSYAIYPGEWLRILTPEETKQAIKENYGIENGEVEQKQTTGGIGIAKYRYVNRQLVPINTQAFNSSIPILDARGNVIKPESLQGSVPPEMYVYMINGKMYQSVSPSVSYKDTELIVPRDQMGKIEKSLMVLNNPASSQVEKDQAIQTILDQGGLDAIKAFGAGIGLSTVVRDITQLYKVMTGKESTISADTINRFMTVMGMSDPTQKRTTLSNPKLITMQMPSLIPGMPSKAIQVNEFIDKDGKKYYSQDLSSQTYTVTKNIIGVPIAQAISLSLALRTLEQAKTPEQRQQAILGMIDSIPNLSNQLGIEGYSFSDVYKRISQFDQTLSGSLKPETINRMIQDPLIKKFMDNMSINSEKFGTMPVNKQFELVLVMRDILSGNMSPVQSAALLQQTIQGIPGAEAVFPKINGQPLLSVVNAISQVLNFDPGKGQFAQINPQTIITISSVLGLSQEDIAKLNPGKIANIMSVVLSIQASKNNPKALQEAMARASSELPNLLPGVPNESILRGIFSITGVKDPMTMIGSYLSNKGLIAATEKLLGVKILGPDGKLMSAKLTPDNLFTIFTTLSDVEKGRMIPLAAVALLSEKGFINLGDVGKTNLIELANSLSQLGEGKYNFDNKNLANLLKAVNIDASSLVFLSPEKLSSLSTIVSDFGSGDPQKQQTAVGRFQIEILPDLNLSQEMKGMFDKISAKMQAGFKINDIAEVQEMIQKDPKFRELLVQLGMLGPESGSIAGQSYTIKGLNRPYNYNPSVTTMTPDKQRMEIVGVGPNGSLVVRIFDISGNPLEDRLMTVESAESAGIPISSDPAIANALVDKSPTASGAAKKSVISQMSPGEALTIASSLRQLLDGRIDIFQFACVLQNMPSAKAFLGSNINFLGALSKINSALSAIKFGGVIDIKSFETLSTDLGLKLNSSQQIMLGQAAALASAWSAYNKGDYATTIFNIASAFPETKYSTVAMRLAANLVKIQKGNPIEILKIFENDPDLVRILKKLKILGPLESSLYIKSKSGKLSYSDALLAGSTVLDLIHGKIDPLVAAKRLLEVPGLEQFLGGAGKSLAIATDLYEEALKFGHSPIDPAAIDASITKLAELTHVNIGKLGLPGVNGLSYGQAVAIVNALSMALNGKWQQALMQLTFLIPIPGGWSVGIVLQILFMFFPGLAALFGKGGGGDSPSQNCTHCGCSVKDPAGSDNSRDYKPGGLLCKHCGSEIRSKKDSGAIPGSPPLLSPQCIDYPWNPQARATCGPHTRTGLAKECVYYTGQWASDDAISNHDCAAQLLKLGTPDVTSYNASAFSLYCQDEFAYYDTLAGDWRSSVSGKQKDEQYNTDSSTKSLKQSEYYLKINKAIEDEFKKSPYYGTYVQQFKNISLPSGTTEYDVYGVILQMYADLIRNPGTKATLQQTCQFMIESGALDMGLEDRSRYGTDPACDQLVQKLNYYWTQLPAIPLRDHIFDMFKIKKDYQLLRKSMGEAAMKKK